LFRCSPFR